MGLNVSVMFKKQMEILAFLKYKSLELSSLKPVT